MKTFLFLLLSVFGLSKTQAQCFLNLSVSPNSVCAGQPATLVVTNNVGIPLQEGVGYYFVWNDGVTTPARVVSPSVTTSYSVTVTHISGCATSMERTVIVTPASFLNLSMEPAKICLGQSSVLTMRDNFGQSLPDGFGWSYMWNTGATTASIVVSPIVTTTYTITVTEPGGCTQVMPPQTLVVNSKPDIAIEQFKGIGETVLLAHGTGDFLWGNDSTNQFLKVNQLGWYMVTITDQNGCKNSASTDVTGFFTCPSVDTDTVTVIFHDTDTVLVVDVVEVPVYVPYPVHDTVWIDPGCPDYSGITSNRGHAVCQGDYVILTAPFADSYRWYDGTEDREIVIGTNTPGRRLYSCVIDEETTLFYELVVYAPASTPHIATVGGGDVFCDSTWLSVDQVDTNFLYQWYRNGNAIVGGTGPMVHIGLSGDYAVKVTTPCGTESSAGTWITIVNCSGTTGLHDGSTEKEIAVYPNPSNGLFSVNMPAEIQGIAKYTLFDSQGRVALQGDATEDFEVEGLHLPAGFYTLQVITETYELFTQKVVIQ